MLPELELEKVISQYSSQRNSYIEFGVKLNSYITDKLKQSGIEDFLVKDRAKTIDSFKEKIVRPGKNYADPFNQITDLCGVRIIVFYLDQILHIEDILKSEFTVDEKNSIDKAKSLKPDTFGYLSVHYIIYLNEEKKSSDEWNKFSNLKAEIQIRTRLQDSWATVSHALQYKSAADVPDILKRRLFRLASLFELADEEFLAIKLASEKRLEEIEKQFAEGYKNISIDFLSISQFLRKSTLMQEIINYASSFNTFKIDQGLLEHYNKMDCSLVTSECSRLNIKTIENLEQILRKSNEGNQEFIRLISTGRNWRVTSSFILFLLIIKAFPEKFNTNYLASKYGWDYIISKSVVDNAIKIKTKYNYRF